jgi:hypothetical protein
MAPRTKDITGQRFHKLVALEHAGYREGAKCRKSLWKCICDCGREAIVAYVELTAGATKSCGCIIGQHKRTHGATVGGKPSPEFMAWGSLRARCENPHSRSYKDYGARGIKVCERWATFENFLADMGPRPSPAYSIDRRDNNGNYEPGNCHWTTRVAQSNNRRSSRFLTINGETKTYAEWERHADLPPGRVFTRLKMGWKPEEVLQPSVRGTGKRSRQSIGTTTIRSSR